MTLGEYLDRLENDADRFEAMKASAPISEVLRRVTAELQDVAVQPVSGKAPKEDRLLTVETVADRLNVSPRYVYDHHHEWPFTRHLGSKLRFSEHGLSQWIERSS